jgi:hypothetical protein
MKVKFKTAHGYLSFQPDGSLQYRKDAGEWEEVDIEGLELPKPEPEPEPKPKLKPDLAGPELADIPPSPSVAYVSAVKARLQAQGVNLTGPCGAFAITKRVAWGLRHLGCGLLSKPTGNNCEGFATDIVMFKDQGGQIIDVLGDGGGSNTPLWGVTDTVDPDRWRPAVKPD